MFTQNRQVTNVSKCDFNSFQHENLSLQGADIIYVPGHALTQSLAVWYVVHRVD